jgi:putative flippase GtrA
MFAVKRLTTVGGAETVVPHAPSVPNPDVTTTAVLPAVAGASRAALPLPLALPAQAARFAVVGCCSASLDFALYIVLYQVVGVQVDLAKAITWFAGTTNAYLFNRRWTFQARPSTARYVSVMSLYGLTFAVQVGVNHLILELFDYRTWALLVAYVVAQAIATIINFAVQRWVIFQLH